MIWAVIILYSIIVLILFFWQASNMLSVFYGAPAISSPKHELLGKFASKEKTFLDLGCGIGSVCIAASLHFKQVYGLEYSPMYFFISKFRTRKYKNITILYGNMYTKSWPKVDYIYCYLMPKTLGRLRERLKNFGATVLSYAFKIPGEQAAEVISNKKMALYVYHFDKR